MNTSEFKIDRLRWKGVRGPIYYSYPLAPLTTWKVGGPAQYLAVPKDLEDIYQLLHLAYRLGWSVYFLGRGSNLLIDDRGLTGLTLYLPKSLQGLEKQGDSLRVGAGVTLPRLARTAAALGVRGFEFLGGIPGTVGAAVRFNAGADGQDMAQVLRRVWVVTPQLQLMELSAAELDLGYRTSRLLSFPHWLVVEAEFSLHQRATPKEVQARMRQLLMARKNRQPTNPKTCGSVFKNPPGGPPAGLLIEKAGFKGMRVGDAQVSRKHANYILNQGQATADQIRQLINAIQEGVWEFAGIRLEREVVLLPEDLA